MPSVKLPPLTPLFQMIRPLKTLGVRGNSPNLGVGRFSKRCRGEKKKTHRRAVGVFCESAPAALEPSGPKKESTNRTCEPDFPNKKCWCFIGSPSQKKKQQKECLFIYGHILRRTWSRHDTYWHNIHNSGWNYVSQPRLYHQQEVAPVSRTQANYDKSRLKIDRC